jgi:hypothetical protein
MEGTTMEMMMMLSGILCRHIKNTTRELCFCLLSNEYSKLYHLEVHLFAIQKTEQKHCLEPVLVLEQLFHHTYLNIMCCCLQTMRIP